jgi:drug/metabolite transporter (DMT)-like permease
VRSAVGRSKNLKNVFVEHPLLSFNLFALLIASRDVLTQCLLLDAVPAYHLLTAFFLVTSCAGLLFNATLRGFSISKRLRSVGCRFVAEAFSLGTLTAAAFGVTILGIKLMGAPLFSLVEHALIPVFTVFLAAKAFREMLTRAMTFGLVMSGLSLVVFMSATLSNSTIADGESWAAGIFASILGAALTAYTTFYQKRLINAGYSPDEVLFTRFVFPAIGLSIASLWVEPWEFTGQKLLNLAGVSLVGFALPLVFLCFGFVRSSLSRFASFNILIPAYTFVVGGVLVPAELLKLGDPLVLLGVTGMFIGFAVFQWPEFAVRVASRLRDLTFWSRL